jgi:hypothetical protein
VIRRLASPSLVPLGLGLAIAVGYLFLAPHTADLAAQTARAELFRQSGFVPFWTRWYAGVATPTYSLVTPPLLGWLGAVGLGAAALVVTAALAWPLLRHAQRPLLASSLLVVAAGLDVVSGRSTFAAGAAVALLCLVIVDRGWWLAALPVGALTTATSPVAGVLLLLVVLGLAVADLTRRRAALFAAGGILAALAALQLLARGQGAGYQPFSATSLLMAAGTAAVVAVSPVSRRVRTITLVVMAGLVLAFVVPSAIGSNATRIAVLGAAPAVAASARLRRGALLGALVVASLLPLAQLHNDLAATTHDDGSTAFVAGLKHQLADNPDATAHRVEVVDTATHWPSTYLAPTVSLARGWERQADESLNPVFYGSRSLTPRVYRRFLNRNAVGVVVVAKGVPLDYSATREAALIARGVPYLHQVWQNAHWTMYDVSRPAAMVASPARVVVQQDTGLVLDVPAAGRYAVKMTWSPYLVVTGGRVFRTRNNEVSLHLPKPGRYLLHAMWRWP